MKKILFCALCLIIVVTGCSKKAREKTIEKQIELATNSEAKVDLSKNSVNITGKDDKGDYKISMGESIEIPDNFPKDVYIYQPSKTTSSMELSEGHSITLATQDNIKKIVSKYNDKMKQQKWVKETSMSFGSQAMLVYKKKNRVVNISVIQENDNNVITLLVSKK